MLLIAFSGQKGSGKSYASELLSGKYPNSIRMSFSDPLKQSISIIFGLENKECYEKKEDILDNWNVTPRELMQKIGTDLFRDKLKDVIPNLNMPCESIWVSNMYNRIIKERNKNRNCVIIIDDCRFPDEYDCIRKLGGYVIKVENTQLTKINDNSSHVSEMGCPYNFVIENDNKGYKRLQKQLSNIIISINAIDL